MSAASRGKQETDKLQANIEEQLNRLLTQLNDLEENKEDLADEYEEMKKDTLQQLREFQLSLKKMMQVSTFLIELNQIGNTLYPQPISTMDELLHTNRHVKGNMTLVDQFGSVQLAIQAAVSQAFKTPEVIRMFAKKDSSSLRHRLTNLQTGLKLGKVSKEAYTVQAAEILGALKKLGEKLSAEEETFLAENKSAALSDFDSATTDIGQAAKSNILSSAASANKQAQN